MIMLHYTQNNFPKEDNRPEHSEDCGCVYYAEDGIPCPHERGGPTITYCKSCGKFIPEDREYCAQCGLSQQ